MTSQVSPESLEEVTLLQGIGTDGIRELLEKCDDVTYQADELIQEEGQIERSLFILLEGTLEVTLRGPLYEETLISELKPNDVFGEMSFFHASPHAATVRATTPVRLLRLHRDDYDHLLNNNSVAALRMGTNAAEILASRLQATDQWITELLQEQESAEIATSWRRFRQSLGATFEHPHGFFRP